MRTSGPDVLKVLARSTVALLCVLTLASCDAGDPEAQIDHLCEIAPSSDEEVLLREILHTEDIKTQITSRTSRVVEKLQGDLREMGPEKRTLPAHTCAFWPGQEKSERATFSFGWVPRAVKDKDAEGALPNGVPYEVNGILGESTDTYTKLYVQCDMPGDLGQASKAAWLYANASYPVDVPRTDNDRAARDRQTALTYLMARRVTDALGCENKPLEKAPVVRPVPSPSPSPSP
ncbi:hypothetical protein ACH4U5_37060 [Streptomyces sp. NPDC020858]|uniref:hypothetical protein n=1 Tax=Streptomyces sp. NPDC020858 TaxID=3365097 RepID=UPI0037935C5A